MATSLTLPWKMPKERKRKSHGRLEVKVQDHDAYEFVLQFFRSKKKEGGGHVDRLSPNPLSPNVDTESIISSRSAKSLKKTYGKKKAP